MLIRDARDVLDAVLGVSPSHAAGDIGATEAAGARASDPLRRFAGIDPPLREVLTAVVAGRDTVAALASAPADVGRVLAALGELELLGALRRVAGGRYVVPYRGGRG
jgi:hypothetical protein